SGDCILACPSSLFQSCEILGSADTYSGIAVGLVDIPVSLRCAGNGGSRHDEQLWGGYARADGLLFEGASRMAVNSPFGALGRQETGKDLMEVSEFWIKNGIVGLHGLANSGQHSAECPPILIIPGLWGQAEQFIEILAALEPRKAYSLSLRGRG